MSCKRSALVVARKNAGFTQEELAARLGVDRATIGRWESGANEPLAWIRPKLARILGLSPAQLAKVLEVRSEVGPNRADLGDHNKRNYCYSDDVERWIAEVADTSVDDSRIEQISRATIAVAETHSAAPARRVLAEVLRLHDQICRLFGRPQRLRQKRELLRIDSDLLAHACVLFGDIKQNDMAEKYGLAALRCAAEAESSQAKPRTALAKTLRWQRRFVESMDLAILGFEHSPPQRVKVQLASQEANAAALIGDVRHAKQALDRAVAVADSIPAESGSSVWSFPHGRRAIFALSVALAAHDGVAALDAARNADDGWARGEPMNLANWAQIRAGAAMAHLLDGSLDAAIQEASLVLTLPPALRVSTVIGYMDNLCHALERPPFHRNRAAIEFRDQIQAFDATALSDESPGGLT